MEIFTLQTNGLTALRYLTLKVRLSDNGEKLAKKTVSLMGLAEYVLMRTVTFGLLTHLTARCRSFLKTENIYQASE